MTILEELKGGSKKAPNGIRSGMFSPIQLMTELTFQTCSRKRADVPDIGWLSMVLQHIADENTPVVLFDNINLAISAGDEFNPDAKRTVLTGQRALTFLTFLAGELFLYHSVSDELASDEMEELQFLKQMLVTENGERRMTYTNPVVDKIMESYVNSAISGKEYSFTNAVTADEKGLKMCFEQVHYFLLTEDENAYPLFRGMLQKIVVPVSQIANEGLAATMLKDFEGRNEPN